MSWITTFTGKRFYQTSPHRDSVCIEDIAHALSMLCRFTGHCREFYSVAEHSIRVAYELQSQQRIHGLLHDAHEAYLGDTSGPLKKSVRVCDSLLKS